MTNGTPGWKGYYLSAYGIAVKHGYRGTEEEWLQSLKQEAVDAGEEALSGAAMATAAAAGAQAATTTATTAATAANTAAARTEAAVDLAAKQAELAQKAADSATEAKEGADHAAASATTAASAANTAKSNAEAAAALADQEAKEAKTATTAANSATTSANHAASVAYNSRDAATAAAEQAQTKGDYAKTQGDRADRLLGVLENMETGAIAQDVLALQADKAERAVSVSVTLTASGWTGAHPPYTQTVSVAGLKAGQCGEIGLASAATPAEREAAREASLCITGQAEGSVTITADGDKPVISLPCDVTLLG